MKLYDRQTAAVILCGRNGVRMTEDVSVVAREIITIAFSPVSLWKR